MAEKKIFLEKGQTVNEIFANDSVNNLRIAEDVFTVELLSRDNWIKIKSDEIESVEKAEAFFNELAKVLKSGSSIKQKDFERLLNLSGQAGTKSINNFYNETIKVSPTKSSIIPRTLHQYEYIKEIKKNDIVFGIGPAGTGKTYLAMAMAVSKFLAGEYDRIILTRPTLEAGENLGFLPGTLEEKIKPYLRPLYDALYEMLECDEANKLMENNIIEVAPLAFMRGRTLNNSFIILDEAQNTTNEQMMMFLTRLGFKSKCLITGDPTQTDLPNKKLSGLDRAIKILEDIDDISILKFTAKDVVRNPLVEKIINAYEKNTDSNSN